MTERYRVEPTGRGFWPFCVVAGDGTLELFIGHRKSCEQVAAELTTAFMDGEFVGKRDYDALHAEAEALRAENERLRSLINTPHTDEWIDAVRLEAAHQIERWGTSHDAGKTPADWFWLLGYLGQKAMAAQMAGDEEKAKHHTISSGAMLLNWFRAVVGDTNAMRPGIEVKQ